MVRDRHGCGEGRAAEAFLQGKKKDKLPTSIKGLPAVFKAFSIQGQRRRTARKHMVFADALPDKLAGCT